MAEPAIFAKLDELHARYSADPMWLRVACVHKDWVIARFGKGFYVQHTASPTLHDFLGGHIFKQEVAFDEHHRHAAEPEPVESETTIDCSDEKVDE